MMQASRSSKVANGSFFAFSGDCATFFRPLLSTCSMLAMRHRYRRLDILDMSEHKDGILIRIFELLE